MAIGDRIVLADKETLDTVNANVGSVQQRIGTPVDTGGTTSGGTLMGKVNAALFTLNKVWNTWTDVKAAFLDAKISTRQSAEDAETQYDTLNTNTAINNTPSATGFLSQKLTYIINQLSGMGQKKLASKAIDFSATAAGTQTILNVSGGGRFDFAYTNCGNSASPLTIIVDGQTVTLSSYAGNGYIGNFLFKAGALLSFIGSSEISTNHIAGLRPIFFKKSLVITVAKSATTTEPSFFKASYALYE